MAFFIVRYEHPDAEGWQRHLAAHITWLRTSVANGTVRASGPLVGVPDRAAMLIMAAPDRAALDAVIATDPFAEHGLIANLSVAEWDPIFGAFGTESTMPSLGSG